MTTVDDIRVAWITLGCLVEPGNRDLGEEVDAHGPVRALEMVLAGRLPARVGDAAAARLAGGDPRRLAEAALAHAERLGARLATPEDEDWPGLQFAGLAKISRDVNYRIDRDTYPPLCLWLRGARPLADAFGRSVAIVGSRAATSYGDHVATELAYGIADRGWTVVSGGAYGIDASAHRGALTAGGLTVAVLACGIDRPYPVSNTSLFERIAEEGLLISEWPPGAEPHRHRFLIRNRVIAAATRGTVVVEAAARSGATQTLKRASELGRSAMAVPGPVTSPMSVGSHEALRMEGMRLVTGWPHVLEEVGRIGEDLAPLPRGPEQPRDRLDLTSAQVLEAIPRRRATGPEEIAAVAGLPLREVLSSLSVLTAGEFVVARDGGYLLPPPPKPGGGRSSGGSTSHGHASMAPTRPADGAAA